MQTKRLQIPGGMQDTLPDECTAKHELESRLRPLFASWGYREIETPILEYYDALDDEVWGYRPEHVWKTFDRDSRILALRPDTTIPAVRLACSKLQHEPLPLRLCYLQTACKYERDTLSMLSEQTQAGVELMGEGTEQSDLEILTLAARALQVTGIEHVQLEIGHVGFLRRILAASGLSRDLEARTLELLGQKNAPEMEAVLTRSGVAPADVERLVTLTRLYGTGEVLDEARTLTRDPVALQALDALGESLKVLKTLYPSMAFSLDLGMEQEAGYYSGIVFQAQTPDVGQPILSGGRYDHLPERYGRQLPAVGFAMSLKLALIALEKQNRLLARGKQPVALSFGRGAYLQAHSLAEQLRQNGETVALLYSEPESLVRSELAAGRWSRAAILREDDVVWLEGGGTDA